MERYSNRLNASKLMNTDLITLNECRNDGKTIYAYYQPISGAWFTYGISAYLLKNLCKENGIQALETYSKEMQMPCVFVIDIVDVAQGRIVKKASSNYYELISEAELDNNEYRSWAKILRNR